MKRFYFLLLSILCVVTALAVEVPVSRTNWTITACNTCPSGYEGSTYDGNIAAAIDDNTTTFYHSDWSGSSTTAGNNGLQAFLIDMGEDVSNLTGFDYCGRSNSSSGHTYTCRVYVYADGALPDDVSDLSSLTSDNKETVLASTNTNLGTAAFNNSSSAWSFSSNTEVKTGTFSSTQSGRYILFIQDTGSDAWLTCADFNVYQESSSAVYTVVIDGGSALARLTYNGTKYANGSTISSSTAITADMCTASTVQAYKYKITVTGTTITVKYYVDMQPSLPDDATISMGTPSSVTGLAIGAANASDNDHWYMLTQIRGGETPAYDAGDGSTPMRADSATATVASLTGGIASDCGKYLVRFINTTTTGVYYVQFGTGRFLSSSLTANDEPEPYAVYNINSTSGHFAICCDSVAGKRVDNNGPGYGLAFWGSGEITETGGNNDWYIYPVTFTTVSGSITTITWNITDTSGTQLASVSKEKCIQGTSYDFPSSYDYVTLSGNTTVTATSSDQTVTLKATVSGLPFTPSTSYSSATWYWVKNRGSKYMKYQADSTKYELDTLVTTDDIYKWAFIGNPIAGYRIINKAAGSSKNLYIETPANGAYPTMSTTEQSWAISQSTYEDFDDPFGLSVDGYYLNNYANEGYLSLWTGAPSGDIGSNLQVITPVESVDYHVVVSTAAFASKAYIEYDGNKGYNGGTLAAPYSLYLGNLSVYEDDDYNYSISQSNDTLYLSYTVKDFNNLFATNIAPYFLHHGAVYGLTDAAYNSNLSAYTSAAAMDSITGSVYRSLLSAVQSAAKVGMTSGYYRILNSNYDTHYLQTTGSHYSVATTQGLSSVFYINATDSTIMGEGVYISDIPTSSDISQSDTVVKTPFKNYVANKVIFGQHLSSNGWPGYHYIHEDPYQNVVGWAPQNAATQWYILPVSTIDLALSQVDNEYITTLYSPYNLTITGATAYAADDTTNPGYMTLTSTSVVNAATGYVVKGTSASATMQITTSSSSTNSVLTGTNLAVATEDVAGDNTLLVMSNRNGVLGFYQYAGAALAGNKAYYVSSDASSVKGMLFVDEATGIDKTIASDTKDAIYDLSGRCVEKAEKGLYIRNGKKYVIK